MRPYNDVDIGSRDGKTAARGISVYNDADTTRSGQVRFAIATALDNLPGC